ncbi:MAG: insulinase family protein [Flavobacteriaceae bacterium]|nr:insulinase family protein [Flavobacteriaceae bacterium]
MKKIVTIITVIAMMLNATAQVDRSKMPERGVAPKIQLGKPQTFTLDNGLKVLVVENHKLPRASVRLSIDNPPIKEGEKAGVNSLLSSVLGMGTTTKTKDEFNKRVDYLGANVNIYSSGASAFSLSKYFDEVFALMVDGIFNPVFTQEDFDAEKAKMLEGLKSNENNVQSVASTVRSALLYGKDHPWGEITNQKTVENVTLDDVKAFYKKNFKPNNAYLVVIGDVKFDDIKKKVTEAFSSWKKAPESEYVFPEVKNVNATEIDFIDMPNAVQSEIKIVSTHDLKMSDPDYHKVLMANSILGGGFNSYLNMNLREAHAWTYGAYSNASADRYKGNFTASTSVRNVVTDSAVVEAMKEIQRIKKELVSAEKLSNSKAKYVGNFVMALENPGTIAGYAITKETNNLPDDFYETYLEKIEKVTPQDVKEVANKYFKEDKMRIIIVGKAVDVLPALEKLPYPIHYFDKEGNPTTKPELNKEVSKDVTAKSVLEKYIQAVGGMEALKKVQTLKTVSEGQIQGQNLEMTVLGKAPNKYAMVMEIPTMGMKLTEIKFNGEKGTVAVQGNSKPMSEEMLKPYKENTSLFLEVSLLSQLDKVSLEAIEKVEGKDAYKLVLDNKSLKNINYYDVNSGLLLKEEQMKDGKIVSSSFSSDYKEVKGVKFPHTIKMNAGGMNIEFKRKSILINEGVTDADFE